MKSMNVHVDEMQDAQELSVYDGPQENLGGYSHQFDDSTVNLNYQGGNNFTPNDNNSFMGEIPNNQQMMMMNPQGPGYMAPQQNNMMQPVPMMPMGPQMIQMAPQNPNQLMQGQTFSLTQLLESVPGIYIKQKFELLEAITGCETKNKYYVFERSRDGGKFGNKFLKCKESSGWCVRNCLSGDCRPFKMRCHNLWNNDQVCLEMVRECQCSCLCFNRPKMDVYYTENGAYLYLGKVVDDFDCCNYSFSVYDNQGIKIYHIEAKCCQCGIWCQCPCDSCERIEFQFYAGDKRMQYPENIKKTGNGCLKNTIGDADNFSIPYPSDAPVEHRSLLMAAALLIDYRMFENKSGGNEVNHNY